MVQPPCRIVGGSVCGSDWVGCTGRSDWRRGSGKACARPSACAGRTDRGNRLSGSVVLVVCMHMGFKYV